MTHIETMKIIETNTVIKIPGIIAKCPYCGDFLTAQCSEWTQADDGTWKAERLEVECVSAPIDEEFDDYLKWESWLAQHTYMPYVYMLPIEITVLKWVNKNYRWILERPS